MQISNIPAKFALVWGEGASSPYITVPIPLTTPTPGRASLSLGFPPLNFTPRGSGGIPPFGEDFNGIFNQITSWNQWQQAGGTVVYDSAFSTAVNGYPEGAVLRSAVNPQLFYVSTTDNNTTNPDDPIASSGWQVLCRIRLAAATNFYVRSDGSDNNTGLANNAGGAWLTLQHAFDTLAKLYDANGFQITINVGAGTFAGLLVNQFPVGVFGSIILNGAGSTTIFSSSITNNGYGQLLVQNVKMGGAGNSTPGFVAENAGSFITLGAGIEFGAISGATNAHIYASGGAISITANYTISGGAAFHITSYSSTGGISIGSNITCTLTGTPAFSTAFVSADIGGHVNVNLGSPQIVYSGSATGQRYVINNQAGIFGTAGAANFFPGSSPGFSGGNGAVYN